jgi:hypothetical protein
MSANLITSKQVQEFIKDNVTLSNKELATKLNVPLRTISSNVAAMKSAMTRANKKANQPTSVSVDKKAYNKAYYQQQKNKKNNLSTQVKTTEVVETYVAEVIEQNDYYIPTELERKALALIKKEQIPLVDNYNNADGENKKEERNIIAEYIANSGVVGLIPSLPHITWEIERKINNLVEGNHFIGVNRVVDTFNQSKSYVKENGLKNCTPYNGSMADLIYDKDADTFAHYILDYCCQLPTAMKQVEYIFHNDLVVVNGLLLMTFGLPIRGGKYADKIKEFSNYNNNNESDNRGLSDKALENYFINLVGKNYKILDFHYYQDTYPMVLVVVKRMR